MDIYQICLNEVALEGLDGITVSALWLRLNSREEKIGVTLSPILQEILWKFLLQHSCIEFFQIASERSDPVIFNRYISAYTCILYSKICGLNEKKKNQHTRKSMIRSEQALLPKKIEIYLLENRINFFIL